MRERGKPGGEGETRPSHVEGEPVPSAKPKRRPGRQRSGVTTADGRIRSTYEFYPETVESIERIRRRTASVTASEVVRKAIGLLDRHLQEADAGAKVVYERADGTRVEIVLV
jgi:hypothetical protein